MEWFFDLLLSIFFFINERKDQNPPEVLTNDRLPGNIYLVNEPYQYQIQFTKTQRVPSNTIDLWHYGKKKLYLKLSYKVGHKLPQDVILSKPLALLHHLHE